MPIITLTTDRQLHDFYIGRIKGQIYKDCPGAVIVDLAHDVGNFNINKAAFILKHSYKNFPEGTVHLIGVDNERGRKQEHLIVKANNQYFIGADNGIFSLIFEGEIVEKIIEVKACGTEDMPRPGLFDFVKIASKIIKEGDITICGTIRESYKQKFTFNPIFEDDFILGNIIYIDSYQNGISNIDKNIFEMIGKGRKFKIMAGSTGNVIHKISEKYQDNDELELLAIFNSLNLLEIALNRGKACELFNFNTNTKIRINFYDNEDSENDFR